MRAIILSAGRAVRLGNLAPRGCKVLTKVGGVSVLRRQLDLLDGYDVTVVARSAHVDLLKSYPVEVVAHDLYDGPVGALNAAEPVGDTLVVYGDTLWERLPEPPEYYQHTDGRTISMSEWIGVAGAPGGRKWDVISGTEIGYRWVGEDQFAIVCVGLYRFAHAERLTGPSMPEALARYGPLQHLAIPGWRDVGDIDAVAAFTESQPATMSA